jgi:hypothetical protein
MDLVEEKDASLLYLACLTCLRWPMNYKYAIMIAICYGANCLLFADLYDMYNLPTARSVPLDVQNSIAVYYLQQEPFPFTIPQTIPFEESTLIFKVNDYCHPWGVDYFPEQLSQICKKNFANPNGIITFASMSLGQDECDLWMKTNQGEWILTSFFPLAVCRALISTARCANVRIFTYFSIGSLVSPYKVPKCAATKTLTDFGFLPSVSCDIYTIYKGIKVRASNWDRPEGEDTVDIRDRHIVISNMISASERRDLTPIDIKNFYPLFLTEEASSYVVFYDDALLKKRTSDGYVKSIKNILTDEQIGDVKLIATIMPEDPSLVYIWKHVGHGRWKQVTLLKHNASVYSVAFNTTYTEVVTASSTDEVRMWQLSPALVFPFLIDYVPNKKMSLEQLLFLKLINRYWVKGKVDLRELAELYYTPLAMNLLDPSAEGVLRYLKVILDSFGPLVREELIHRYTIINSDVPYTPYQCAIQ